MMPKCPRCGKDNKTPAREWVGGAKTSEPMTVKRFVCASCGSSYVMWLDSKTGKTRTMTRKKSRTSG